MIVRLKKFEKNHYIFFKKYKKQGKDYFLNFYRKKLHKKIIASKSIK